MLAIRDNLVECFSALRGHKLRASLTALGLTMGVATLITVMTIVQGANLYVEQKIANLGTNVFQIAHERSRRPWRRLHCRRCNDRQRPPCPQFQFSCTSAT